LNSRLVVVLSVVVIALLAGGFLVVVQQGATTSTKSQSTTSIRTGGDVDSVQSLQLRLSVNASFVGGLGGGATVQVGVDEYNTLAAENNVSAASRWALDSLSLGSCGTGAYPFGVALYRGSYTAANVSQAEPLQVHPAVPCPLLLRLVTGYLFQPASDMAVILPSGPGSTSTPMSANVTATREYAGGAGATTSSSTPLGPGTYTAVAGDEWGSVVVVRFTVGAGTASTGTVPVGTLTVRFSVGPIQPVCKANATLGPAPDSYSSIEGVVTSSSGAETTLAIAWISSGCEVSGTLEASLAPGAYSLSLSSCPFMGCGSALPKSFVMVAGKSTTLAVSIDTGIR
jgi:hypothetical protein